MREVDKMLLAAHKDEMWLIDYCKGRGDCLWDEDGEVFFLSRKDGSFPQNHLFLSAFRNFEPYSVDERCNILDSVMYVIEGVRSVYPFTEIVWNEGMVRVYHRGIIHVRSFTHKKWKSVFVNKDEGGLDKVVREVLAYADKEERMLRWAFKKAEEYGFEILSYTKNELYDKNTYILLFSGGRRDILEEWTLPKLMKIGYKGVEMEFAELAIGLA